MDWFRLIYVPTIVANSSDAELAALAALSAAFISFKMVSYAPAALSVSPAGSLVWSKIVCRLLA